MGNIDLCLAAGYRGMGCFSVAASPVKIGGFARCLALTVLAEGANRAAVVLMDKSQRDDER